MNCRQALHAAALTLGLAWSAGASAIVIDGDLSDWGVSVADGNLSVFGTVSAPGLDAWHIDDSSDTAGDGGFLNPLYGGQNYDAEFMAVAIQGDTLYLAIATGVRPDNGASRYGPGDIRIQAANGVRYGIEVGGGAGNSSLHQQRVDTTAGLNTQGSTYILNGNGYTASHSFAAAAQSAGSIWSEVTWLTSPLHGYPLPAPNSGQTLDTLGFFYANTQFAINGSSVNHGSADYVYTRDESTSQHAVIELAIPNYRPVFGYSDTLEIYWGPSCGNDIVLTLYSYVPEPGALALSLTGLGLIGWTRRRRA